MKIAIEAQRIFRTYFRQDEDALHQDPAGR